MTEANDKLFAALRAPFPPDDIEWRQQQQGKAGGTPMLLPYITGRAVMDRLDSVVGPAGWRDTYMPVERAGSRGWICKLEITLPDGSTVSHEDGADETNIEATKGGISDALKRAAVKFGIGRYLYFLPRFYAPREGKAVPALPPWALPGGTGRPVMGRGAAGGEVIEQDAAVGSGVHSATTAATPAHAAASPERGRSSNQEHLPRQVDAGSTPAAPTFKAPPLKVPERLLSNGPPPFDLNDTIRFGKFKGKAWGYMVMGDPEGERRSWLRWVVGNLDAGSFGFKRADALLRWIKDPDYQVEEAGPDAGDGPDHDQGDRSEGMGPDDFFATVNWGDH